MLLSEVLKNSPQYLKDRFGSLSSYVWESLFPESDRAKILKKTKKENRGEKYLSMKAFADEASFLVFIFVISKVFMEGSKAAKRAVDTLKELEVQGFYLGQAFYSERNENVVMGDVLAAKLLSSIDPEARKLVSDAQYISDILNRYKTLRKEIYG